MELENERRNVQKAKEAYANTVSDFDRKIVNLKTMIGNMRQEEVIIDVTIRKYRVITYLKI